MFIRIAILFLLTSVQVLAQDRRVTPVSGGRRMALVIGNDAYPWKPLTNAVNDARALAAVLPKVGFDVRDITLLTNANLKQMQRAGREFVEKLRPDDLAFVYYSGHGVEVRGENFLIPVDFPGDATELEVRDEAYSAQQLLRGLEETQARTRILILDACRNNPLRATRSAGGGLARMDGKGTLVVFATSAGSTADDNPRGSNGLFTSQLLRALPTPGVTLGQMVQDVARAVYRESGTRQTPAIYGLLLEDFPLVAGANAIVPPVKTDEAAIVREAWDRAKQSGDRAAIETFLREFPESPYAGLARVELASLNPARTEPMRLPDPPTQRIGKTKVNPKDGLTYVWIEPGTFMMGCSPGDNECANNPSQFGDSEGPVHQVIITRGYWIGQSPVTQEAFQRVTGTNPSEFRGTKLPVERVGWNLARNYCQVTGMRLPTEAEWEYAARAGSTSSRYGDIDQIAWYKDNSGGTTHEVMQKKPNAWGLYDVFGNVWQWTADWSMGRYLGSSETDPHGPATGQFKILRGGAFKNGPTRVSGRLRGVMDENINGAFGFRARGTNILTRQL